MQEKIFEQIKNFLEKESVEYKHIHHEPTYTSEESARVRGEDISIGGKAMLVKVGEKFHLFVLSAALRIDSEKIREHFFVKKLRFATQDELVEKTGLEPGCIPPFGKPIFSFELFVDNSILKNEKIAFNAGSLQDSIIMSVSEYIRVAKPKIMDFSK
ncbi:MAG: hypothetical protein COV59_01595 [Candidatus Magasanikbacteria bacterium CG11_big_fil_rev_8_21_14_0_20_39_34]|uniref:YbaK/aminoacyl-tRNA synthetase-associated domain-containing protein n=1 Tax=Candidatus Magasanikbacteria bacterium CG11_big_fil_rev_8_21_14_0_20_39_34 TaxID=1974653 RepID=A0A2H0N5Y5_9BACT|nr:MAG: hypothetical protein COV59_01595 [Candidatus Magasanikbacteria bacterium CG11_big_fil_rev_8_21_14_0_20_39_34]